MLSGRPRYTTAQVAERTGIPIEELERQWRSIGVAVPARDEVVMSAEDLAAADRMREVLDAGLDPEQLAELGRTVAVAMSQFAAASRQVVAADVRRRRRDRARGLRPRSRRAPGA